MELKSLTDRLIKYVENTEEFLTEQTPLFIKELVSFKFFEQLVWLIATSLVTIAGLIGTYHGFKFIEDSAGYVRAGFICFVVFGFLFGCILEGIITLIKIKVAPKVFIVEELKDLTKK